MLNYKIKYVISAVTGIFIFLSAMLAETVQGMSLNDIIIKIDPPVVLVGESSELRFISIAGFIELDELPVIPGLKWSSDQAMQSKQTRIINNHRQTTFNTVYYFTVKREGTITIPAMKVRIGNIVKKLKPVTFKAFKQKLIDPKGHASDIDELIYISAVLLTDRDYIYLGEEIPLEIRMYSLRNLPVTCSWPVLDADNIVLKNYGNINPDSPNFIPPVRRTVKLEKMLYNVDIFRTAIRAISPGNLKGKISIPCVIKIPKTNNRRKRRTGDPFEDFFRNDFFSNQYRTIRYKLKTNLPDKKIKALPEASDDSLFLGLAGEWSINVSMSSEKLKSGDPVTLQITVSGKGTLDTLIAPELKLPGFQVYPPEVNKSNISINEKGKAEIKYALIPCEEGPVNIDLKFSSFSVKSEKYKKIVFKHTYNVKKGENTVSSVVDDSGALENGLNAQEINSKREKFRHGILYLKRDYYGGITLPLYKNNLFGIILFILLGPLGFIVVEVFYYRKRALQADPALRRKSSAKKRKRKIINILTDSSTDELHNIIQKDITPYLNDMLGFPPGTSAAELADKVDNHELAECLNAGTEKSFMPVASHEDPETMKNNLIKAIQKIALITLCFISIAVICSTANAASAFADNRDEANLTDPLTAYDTGHFKIADSYYKSKFNPKHPDPSLLYNMGNCLFQQGEFAKALVCFERARRLDPSDSDIIENLNYIRRKLMLPEIDKAETPMDSLRNFRDDFRPDTWILLAAFAWSLCWFSILLRRYLSVRKWGTVLGLSLLLFMISMSAYFSQANSTYSRKNAIVIKKDIPVYIIPTTTSRKSEFRLRLGMEVKIEEERHNWIRIRNDQSEGWINTDAVERVWPYL